MEFIKSNYDWILALISILVAIIFGILTMLKKEGKNKKITNNQNGIINTNNQSGGHNEVNFHNDSHNPSNISQKPEFTESGDYGLNLLYKDLTTIKENIKYSFKAFIPAGQNLQIEIKSISSETTFWYIDVFSKKNWIKRNPLGNSQVFELKYGDGDLLIFFNNKGKVSIKGYLSNKVVINKIISVE